MNDDTLTALRAADPVRRIDIEELRADPVFGDLAEAIVAGNIEVQDELLKSDEILPRTGKTRSHYDRTKGDV